jgi:hypothetical protein
MTVNTRECEVAGADLFLVASIVRRLSRAAMDAKRLGLHVFGGSGHGTLRTHAERLVVADLDGLFDGGDGATHVEPDGLMRGE